MMLFNLLYTIVMSFTMVGAGALMVKYPPKAINGVYGYRTKRSRASKEAWEFAQQYAGKVWIYSGLMNAIVFLGILFASQKTHSLEILVDAGYYLQTIVLLLVIPITELKLNKSKL